MSIIEFEGDTAAQLYEEGLYKFRVCGRPEHSRNGPVLVMPEITVFRLMEPRCRVLDDHIRNANPFFHMMEFIWMMAGRLDVEWIAQFNKQYREYADDGQVKAAYGYRWRRAFGFDQIRFVINQLKRNPTSRQATLQMWLPQEDLPTFHKDKACNISIMFRNNSGALDMLVTNRSNDFVWGALGANIVHMTMLHELVSHFSKIPLGRYSVVSMNLHIYTEMPNYQAISNTLVADEIYKECEPLPLFGETEEYNDFVSDCENFCNGDLGLLTTDFLGNTALPAYVAWKVRENREHAYESIATMKHPDWRIACQNYLKRKTLLSATLTEP